MRAVNTTLLSLTLATGLVLTGVTACSSSTSASGQSVGSPSAASSVPALTGSIVVFAASSLTGAFNTIGAQFKAAHPGVTITFNFGASSTLSTQIDQGAPADVFASAAPANMESVVKAGNADSSTNFASNSMEIAVPPTNPASVTQLSDLAKSSVKVALCQAPVPCGATAVQVFKNAGITVTPVTQEADVKTTLSKVEGGDADAGVVYITDVLAAGSKVKGIQIPATVNASTEYPIATLTHSAHSAVANAFVAYVRSTGGLAVLSAAGFAKP